MICSARRLSAFTLIELLVVISIIAILVGILLPTMSAVRRSAVRSACMSNLRNVGIAIESYRQASKNLFPLARYMPDPFITSLPEDPPLTKALAQQLPQNSEVYRCPGDENFVFPLTGISYNYNASLAGRNLESTWFVRRMGFKESEIPVAYDVDGNTFTLTSGSITVPPFHTERNLLFADGHVGDYVE